MSLSNILGYGQPQQSNTPFVDLGAPVTPENMATAQGVINNYGQGGLSGLLGSFGGNGSTGLLGLGQLGLGAFGAFNGMVGANRAYGMAKDQFNFTKNLANTNLTNQIQSYNTALADRARARAAMEGRDQASADRYIEENKLRR